jgi:2-dehydro-3-deoxyphosphogalactonate aldolase
MSLPLRTVFSQMPLLAVLRGIDPGEAEAVGSALVGAGIRALEVTLDSPDPFRSVELLSQRFGGSAFIAAGTVLRAEQVAPAVRAGAQAIVAPNFNARVVEAANAAGVLPMPGVLTPTEAFAALDAGAGALKIFPGDAISPAVMKGLRAVLPKDTLLCVTGGVGAENVAAFLAAGADAAGIGSALYKPGRPPSEIAAEAARLVEAVRGRA